MLIIGGDDKMIRSTKDMLKSKFDMKGMGLSYVILGIKITRTQNSLVLSQTHYVDKILEKFYKGDTSITKTPSDTKRIVLHKVEYSRILDSLMYLMSCTRLDLGAVRSTVNIVLEEAARKKKLSGNGKRKGKEGCRWNERLKEGIWGNNGKLQTNILIWLCDSSISSIQLIQQQTNSTLAYAVSKLSRYTSNASVEYWRSITRLLRYLRYTRECGLHYGRHPTVIKGYSDVNWISDIKDSRSTSGYVFTLGSATISWKSSKKTIIARSTMESEFIALDKCGEKLCQFVEDVPKWPKPVTVICIHCDSQSKIGRAQSTIRNMIRQLISIGVISIDYVKSKDNIVDPLTKSLSRDLVYKSLR
ncbi:LOW QUALITY PROTEIN: hypothetical protein OSB04_017362 [Centaurea solstitialis]|uniref:Reverse transcriptase Ty1/copia-type domain-containing protein n=1 Tax=Centaurea solstitialis TaxID=347529 RepID=A0AA38TKU5_9ASTR|nr:LOW QUALITY PROTEIN: hypothetical protein OSB04_017362 [Centaurea solstitialis]